MVIDTENYTFNKEWLDGVAAKAVERLEKLQISDESGQARIKADAVLCEVLKAMGFDDVVDAWESVGVLELMSDIKVYWESNLDIYYVYIDDWYPTSFLETSECIHELNAVFFNETIAKDYCELVYDSTEDHDDRLVYEYTEDHDEWEFSLIKDNLRIPSLAEIDELNGNCNSLVRQVFPDYESWCHFWVVADEQRLYHEERTA